MLQAQLDPGVTKGCCQDSSISCVFICLASFSVRLYSDGGKMSSNSCKSHLHSLPKRERFSSSLVLVPRVHQVSLDGTGSCAQAQCHIRILESEVHAGSPPRNQMSQESGAMVSQRGSKTLTSQQKEVDVWY